LFSGIQYRPVVLGDGLKQNAWGGSGKPKIVVNGACLASAADHENSVKKPLFHEIGYQCVYFRRFLT
jgi:hypothetical protein